MKYESGGGVGLPQLIAVFPELRQGVVGPHRRTGRCGDS